MKVFPLVQVYQNVQPSVPHTELILFHYTQNTVGIQAQMAHRWTNVANLQIIKIVVCVCVL